MGNLSITPAVPAADGTGAGISTAALGLEKTIHVDGTFTGAVTLEISNGNGFVPVATFQAPGRQTLKLAAQQMRVVRSAATAVPGTPKVTVSGNDDGAQFVNLPLIGTSIDVGALGTFNTIVVDGVIDGVVRVQTSEDEVDWVDICSFQTPGHCSMEVVAGFMRVQHVNNDLGSTPTVAVGAINDDTAHKPLNTLVPGVNVTVDGSLSDSHEIVLDQNVIIDNPINVEAGQRLVFSIRQDGAGLHTVTWGSAFLWAGGTAPVIPTGANSESLVEVFVRSVSAAGVAVVALGTFSLNMS